MLTTITLGDIYKSIPPEQWSDLSVMYHRKTGPYWICVAGPIIFDYWANMPSRRGNEFRLENGVTEKIGYFDIVEGWGSNSRNLMVPEVGVFIHENVSIEATEAHLRGRFGKGATLIKCPSMHVRYPMDDNSRFLERIRKENASDPEFLAEIMSHCVQRFAMEPDMSDTVRLRIYRELRRRLWNPNRVFSC